MTPLAFLCTGQDAGWNPLCNGSHFALLIGIGVITGTVLCGLLAKKAPTSLDLVGLWLITMFCSVLASLVVGFSLG